MKVTIERNGPDSIHPVLDALAAACEQLGYTTQFWLRQDPLDPTDVLIWWGWNMHPSVVAKVKASAKRELYIEKGWFEDRDYCVGMDAKGASGNTSWALEPLEYESSGFLKMRPDGYLLIALRYERNGKAMDNPSPWFRDNMEWLRHLAHCEIGMPVIVRPHFATYRADNAMPKRLAIEQGWKWVDGSEQIGPMLDGIRVVAVIDSTTGSKAMEKGLPVLCYGVPVYRKPGVVYCLTNDLEKSRRAIRRLNSGLCFLDTGAIQAMMKKMRSKEWHIEDKEGFAERLRKEYNL